MDGVPSSEVRAGDEEPQNDTNFPYQNSDDDEIRVDFGCRVERARRVNVTNFASSSRVIHKRSARARKSNDNTQKELLEVVRDICDDLREDIR